MHLKRLGLVGLTVLVTVVMALSITTYAAAAKRLYTVHSGDTVSQISRLFGVSPSDLRLSNHLGSNSLRPGMILVIPVSHLASRGNNREERIPDKEANSASKTETSVVSQVTKNMGIADSGNQQPTEKRLVLASADLMNTSSSTPTSEGESKSTLTTKTTGTDSTIPTSPPPPSTAVPQGPAGVEGANGSDNKAAVQRSPDSIVDSSDDSNSHSPSNSTYTVAAGDTLYRISKRFHTTVEKLQEMNGLTITLINVDQVLQIPTDASQGSVTDPVPTTPQFQISDADLELLAKVIYAEARGEDFTGQVAVGAVVLNRLRATGFPKTIADVIYQPWAFTCVNDGQFSLVPDDNAREAARQAVAGLDPTGGALYYFNPKTATSAWSMSRPVIKQIGRHVFTM